MNTVDIINLIKNAQPTTPTKVFLKSKTELDFQEIQVFGSKDLYILIGELDLILENISKNKENIIDYYLEIDRRNSKLPLLDLKELDARIEPGAIIRAGVSIGSKVIVMMGAVINVGAVIGRETMIDMNSVIGSRAKIGKRCHIGAGTIVAGVLEPANAKEVIIEDDCFIGANSVILEGITIGTGAIVGAGSIVTTDVLPNSIVYGNPARFIRFVDEETLQKSELINDLR